jgi:hypothetical protein
MIKFVSRIKICLVLEITERNRTAERESRNILLERRARNAAAIIAPTVGVCKLNTTEKTLYQE